MKYKNVRLGIPGLGFAFTLSAGIVGYFAKEPLTAAMMILVLCGAVTISMALVVEDDF